MKKFMVVWLGFLFLGNISVWANEESVTIGDPPPIYTLEEDQFTENAIEQENSDLSQQIDEDLDEVVQRIVDLEKTVLQLSQIKDVSSGDRVVEEERGALKRRMSAVVDHILQNPDPKGENILPLFYLRVISKIAASTIKLQRALNQSIGLKSRSLSDLYGGELEKILAAFSGGKLDLGARQNYFLDPLFEVIEGSDHLEDFFIFGDKGIEQLGIIARNMSHPNHESAFRIHFKWILAQRNESPQGPEWRAWEIIFHQMYVLEALYCQGSLE